MKKFVVIVMTCIFLKPVYMHTLSKRAYLKSESINSPAPLSSFSSPDVGILSGDTKLLVKKVNLVSSVSPPLPPVNGLTISAHEGKPENKDGNIQANKGDQSATPEGLKVQGDSKTATSGQKPEVLKSDQGDSRNTTATDVKQIESNVTNGADGDETKTNDKSTSVVKGTENDGNPEINKPLQNTDVNKAEDSGISPEKNPNKKTEPSPKDNEDILTEQDKDAGKNDKNDNKETDITSPEKNVPSDKKDEEKTGSIDKTAITAVEPKPTKVNDKKEPDTSVPSKNDVQKEEKPDGVNDTDTAVEAQKPAAEDSALPPPEEAQKEKDKSPSEKNNIEQKIEEEAYIPDGEDKEGENIYDNDDTIDQAHGGVDVIQEAPAQKDLDIQGADKEFDSTNLNLNANDKKASGSFSNDEGSHFFAYLLTFMVTAIVFYLVFHNKQRIIALIIEGRSERSRRRPGRSQYRKLDNNLEEAMIATKGSTPSTKPLKECEC